MSPILYLPGTVHPWVTFHPYGRQLHDSYGEAAQWRVRRLPYDNYRPPHVHPGLVMMYENVCSRH